MPRNKNSIFIHIPKNAGKTITFQLGMVAASELNKYRWRSNINRAAKYLLDLTRDKKSKHRLWGTYDSAINLSHATPSELIALGLVDEIDMKNAFTIVRNPIDRVKSIYMHVKEFLFYDSFLAFRDDFFKRDFTDNHNFRSFQRRQIDYIYFLDTNKNLSQIEYFRFEDLVHGKDLDFGGLKIDFKSDHRSIQKNNQKSTVLSAQDIVWIKDYYKEDFEKLNYIV